MNGNRSNTLFYNHRVIITHFSVLDFWQFIISKVECKLRENIKNYHSLLSN